MTPASFNTLINAQKIALNINGKQILNSIDIHLNQGEMVGLIGPNGAGKSSLLKVLAGLNHCSSGSYSLNGKDIQQYSRKALASQLGYLAQDAETNWPLTARRIIELGRLPYLGFTNRLNTVDRNAIQYAIDQTDTQAFLERNINTLSGGERMRVLLARLFATQPNILLADEPIAALDPYHQMHIMELLQQHAHQHGAVLVTLHDLNHAAHYCDRLILIHQGELIGEGSMQSLIEQGLLQQVYNIDIDTFKNDNKLVISPSKRR